MADRAQSEALGFVAVFLLVLAVMSIVTVAGLSQLWDVRDAERLENAERAFETLDDNVEDLVGDGLPTQTTEISLQNARVSYGDPMTINVSGDPVGAGTPFTYEVAVRPIVYQPDQGATKLVAVGGAVFRQQRSGTVMLEEPSVLLGPERSNVLVIQTRAGRERAAVGGATTVLIRTERVDADLYRLNRTTYDLTLNVTSPRASAWREYLDAQSGTTCAMPAPDTVSCAVETDQLAVSVVRVDVTFE
jgi:type II secretory pathway pseudopilin PulG